MHNLTKSALQIEINGDANILISLCNDALFVLIIAMMRDAAR